MVVSSWHEQRLNTVEFLIKSAQHLQVSPIVKYSAFSFFADRFFSSLPTFIQRGSSSSWLLKPVTESTLQLFVLISLWISTKVSQGFNFHTLNPFLCVFQFTVLFIFVCRYMI
uniref:Uncharacterized protein n=1 Tax=Medicago truncatula TaxID=3880 RepID=I3SH62_MEDTR|nr:unknown [Medicago truncatula]